MNFTDFSNESPKSAKLCMGTPFQSARVSVTYRHSDHHTNHVNHPFKRNIENNYVMLLVDWRLSH